MTTPLRATALALTADRGSVYGPLEITLTAPLGVVTGSSGSGKTCLLLSIAGRMKPSSGALEVLGVSGMRQIQKHSAIAGFSGIDDLETSVTVRDAVTERLRWSAPWYQRVPKASAATVQRVLARAFGDLAQPAGTTMIWDLDENESLLLRIALALVDQPRILCVDNVDHVHDLEAQAGVISELARIAGEGVTVIVSTTGYLPELYRSLPVEHQIFSTHSVAADLSDSAEFLAEEAQA